MTDSSVEAVARALAVQNGRAKESCDCKMCLSAVSFEIDNAKAAIAALPSPEREPMRWQPIESAPKDGTDVLMFGQRGDQVDIGSWHGCGRYHARSKAGPAYYEQEWGHAGSPFRPQPTHWMPLPAHPQHTGDRT